MSTKAFNLPWNQHASYWMCLHPRYGEFSSSTLQTLKAAGLRPHDSGALTLDAPRGWKAAWDGLYGRLQQAGVIGECLVSVCQQGEMQPLAAARTPESMQQIADSLWLGDALIEGRVVCYLQPVLSAPGKVFGYESFARVKETDGSVIAGGRIVEASKLLGIEHMIDRHLQVQAIKTFVSSRFNGFLFVNFFPGFIHRPAVYLEGLSDTARSFGIVAKHLVLDLTKSETPRDLAHLRNVCEYARSKGYSVALDDVESIEGAGRLIADIRPDFVKIDMQLGRMATRPAQRDIIRQIVELAHAVGATVVGEGIETEEIHQLLRQLGVDLFQGYLFSPPVAVEVALRQDAAG